jgi:hypothetical protein
MDVTVTEDGDSRLLELREHPALYRIGGLSEHALRDIEFELARRRAMGRVCPVTDGEHTCSLAPGHGEAWHLCRGCTRRWPKKITEP